MYCKFIKSDAFQRWFMVLIAVMIVQCVKAWQADSIRVVETTPDNATDSIYRKDFIPYRHQIADVVIPDSLDIVRHSKKAFWRATAETVGCNLGLWAFDRYVLKGHYSYISWNTIKENFKHGFEWDDDHLHTNMFDHPYNGSLFFNAGRSNGYNFWQSELFAIGGSAMWEMFMEREYPSTNDIIATPVGGAAIGEVLYRTSDLILDDRTTGGERFGRELVAFIVDPMKGISRLLTGSMWKTRATSGRRFGVPPISVELSLGGRVLDMADTDNGTRLGASAELLMEYGDRFAERTRSPYDYFSFMLELQAMKSQPLLSRVEIVGRLLGREVVDRKNFSLNLGMYQHFDFFDSDTLGRVRDDFLMPCAVPYKLGTPASIGAGLLFRWVPCRKFTVDGNLHVNGVILGGILTDFYRDYHRNYNWGSGFSIKAGLNIALADNDFSLRIADQHYRIYTWTGYDPEHDWSLSPDGAPVNIQGDSSKAWFNHFEATFNYRIFNNLYLSLGVDLYTRRTHYYDIILSWPEEGVIVGKPYIDSTQFGSHLMFTYRF